jgi:hypothetical protein
MEVEFWQAKAQDLDLLYRQVRLLSAYRPACAHTHLDEIRVPFLRWCFVPRGFQLFRLSVFLSWLLAFLNGIVLDVLVVCSSRVCA